MTPEFVARVRDDYGQEKSDLDWNSYLAGYWAAAKRFGQPRENRREIKSKLGYSRVGLDNK